MTYPTSQSAKSTHPWIESSKFEPLSQKEILDSIVNRVREDARARIRGGGKPVKVVFDLDGTIFEVKPRSLRILKEFSLTKRAREISPEIADWALGLTSFRLLYTMEESARANGIPAGERKRRNTSRKPSATGSPASSPTTTSRWIIPLPARWIT
jgi:hypothetical protein